MYNENYVIFKGTKDGVTVIFDPEVSFETLCTQLEKKVQEAGKFFDNVKTSLAFKGQFLLKKLIGINIIAIRIAAQPFDGAELLSG